jgi:hypothetical protein
MGNEIGTPIKPLIASGKLKVKKNTKGQNKLPGCHKDIEAIVHPLISPTRKAVPVPPTGWIL